MSNQVDPTDKCTFLVVTGASRGIGQQIAIQTAQKLKDPSIVVLLARSLEGLEHTKAEILKTNPNLYVVCKPIDLTKPTAEELHEVLFNAFHAICDNKFDLAMIVHNVGTIGNVGQSAKQVENYEVLQDYYSVNVYAPIVLNTQFLKIIPSTFPRLIANITSKAAIFPMKSCSFYCAGKSAREMYFRVLAEEEKDNIVTVLNYSPGPIETEMTVEMQANSCDASMVEYFKNLRDTKTILTTEGTTTKFLEILACGKFTTGDRVDYYD